ncbi:hypothetical protein HG536_0F01730 [Torulaspora globosa]|uniref:SCP domain-containing protein n=1 Tax=Torulaspora globosa TaxID=48254 RepID=A0A7G3ZK12_9SACH|nr:uncharacterized protein HG536_0F01730 [Torulaspora globosa]QLL33848.1 hypothetical protein HG536_0F01730 [Torulaspora globosa]
MKVTQLSLLAVAAAAVNGAVVTVTQQIPATVQGIVYVENGQTHTSYSSVGGAATDAADQVQSTSTNAVAQVAQATSVATSFSTRDTTTVSPATTSSSGETSTAEAVTTTSTTSSTPSSSSPSSSALSDFASTILNAHNSKRSLHKDTPSLSWSDKLASYAQDYADKYDCSGTLTHSGGPYGENLALGYDVTGSVDAWYNEIKSYDYNNPSFSSSTGHFTQVVWKSTTQVGCGIKQCNNAWGSYVICSYNPAGNMIGDFADNVEPLK